MLRYTQNFVTRLDTGLIDMGKVYLNLTMLF